MAFDLHDELAMSSDGVICYCWSYCKALRRSTHPPYTPQKHMHYGLTKKMPRWFGWKLGPMMKGSTSL